MKIADIQASGIGRPERHSGGSAHPLPTFTPTKASSARVNALHGQFSSTQI